MPTFAIYKMMFSKASQRNMFAQDGRTVLDKAQEYLEEVLQEKLPIRKENQDKTVTILDNYVEARRDGVTLMVVCNEKKHRYKEKMDEKELEYHPGAYVVIDNREGVAQVAIERSSSFNNKTEKVRELLEDALCKAFARFELKVELRAKMREGDFWDVVEEQQERFKDSIQKVTFDFAKLKDEHPVDAPEGVINKLSLLNSLSKATNAARGSLNLISDKENIIHLKRAEEDIAQLVSMCSHNAYDICVQFKRYGIYRFGGKVMALDTIKSDALIEFRTGQMIMGKFHEGEFDLVRQMEEIRVRTNNYIDGEPIIKKRTRRRS